MNSDPNPDVRRIVLSNIAPSVKTLPAIMARTRDVRDIVRRTAYTVMGEKIHIKALSIANRVRLLHDGLTDRSGENAVVMSLHYLLLWSSRNSAVDGICEVSVSSFIIGINSFSVCLHVCVRKVFVFISSVKSKTN